MNKSVALASAVLLIASGLASANGFYVGAGVGALQLQNDSTYTQTATGFPDINSSQTVHGSPAINGTLLLGYAWEDLDSYFIGLEAFDNLNNAQANATLDVQGDSVDSDLKIFNTYGIRLLPGYHLTPDTVAYGIIGWAHSDMEWSGDEGWDALTSLDGSDTSGYNGAQFGLGMMTKLTSNISMRADLIYTKYNKNTVTSSSSLDGYSDSSSFSVTPSTMEANVNLIYNFG